VACFCVPIAGNSGLKKPAKMSSRRRLVLLAEFFETL
jgi:hypothetical protein